MPRKNSKSSTTPKDFLNGWGKVIQELPMHTLTGRGDLEGEYELEGEYDELPLPTVDDSEVAQTPIEEPVELPAVFTEAQEDRIREIIREEVIGKLSLSQSSFSGYYGEHGANLELTYGEQYGTKNSISSISIDIPKR